MSPTSIETTSPVPSIERGGIQASKFRQSAVEWATTNISNWTDNYMNNTLGKHPMQRYRKYSKNTFGNKNKKTDSAILTQVLTTKRLQLPKFRKDAVTNWAKHFRQRRHIFFPTRFESMRPTSTSTCQRPTPGRRTKNHDDVYEALSAKPPETAVVWRCARHQISMVLMSRNKFFSRVKHAHRL